MSPELRKRMEEESQKQFPISPYSDKNMDYNFGFCKGAEWMHKEEVVPLVKALCVAHEALLWADEMFTARDEMNAKVHCSPRRLSPITLRVKQAIELLEKTKGGEG